MNDAERFEPQPIRLFKIGFDSSFDFLGLHGVQVKDIGYRNGYGLVVAYRDSASIGYCVPALV